MITLLLLQGCGKEVGPVYGSAGSTVKQVDITVLVPVHPSSLEYFDYCIFYSDNTGKEYRDTVRNGLSGEDVIYWRMTFAYKTLPVVCRCETVLVPKVPSDSVVSFSYVIPKPYIFSHVSFNSHSTSNPGDGQDIVGSEVLKIDDISIGSFMSAYGSFFVSTCRVRDTDDGISCSSY